MSDNYFAARPPTGDDLAKRPVVPRVGDWVSINVPHLGYVNGRIVGSCQEPRPTVAVHWLTDTMDLIEVSRLEGPNARGGWYLKDKTT
jgi:hypothetical protein